MIPRQPILESICKTVCLSPSRHDDYDLHLKNVVALKEFSRESNHLNQLQSNLYQQVTFVKEPTDGLIEVERSKKVFQNVVCNMTKMEVLFFSCSWLQRKSIKEEFDVRCGGL